MPSVGLEPATPYHGRPSGVTAGDGVGLRCPLSHAAGDAATDQLRSVAAAIETGSRAALAVALDHMAVAAAA
jgi:hypothetical protein